MIQPEGMVPSDCAECESEDVEITMDTPTHGMLRCRACGAAEEFETARMETFDEMIRGIRARG